MSAGTHKYGFALKGTSVVLYRKNSFRSEEIDIYHVNDFMKTRGWRFNVLQLPPALHFCVTMPQTFTPGVADRFLANLREGVVYAWENAGTTAETTAL